MSNNYCRLFLMLLTFAGLSWSQSSMKTGSLILAKQSFSTGQGGKTVVVSGEGDLEIADSQKSADSHSKPYHYSSVNIFLYMMPLGAQDQPDRLLTVWEAPTGSTQVVVLSLLSPVLSPTGKSGEGRVLLESGGYGLPSILHIRDGEVLIVGRRPDQVSGVDSVESYIVYLWDGLKYKQYATATDQQLWSALKATEIEIQHRNDQNPVIVKH